MVEEQPIQSMPLLEHVQRPSARRSLPFPPPPITLYSPPQRIESTPPIMTDPDEIVEDL